MLYSRLNDFEFREDGNYNSPEFTIASKQWLTTDNETKD